MRRLLARSGRQRQSTCGRTGSSGSARRSRFRRSRSTSSTTRTGSGASTPISTRRAAPPSSSNAATRRGAPRAWTAPARRDDGAFLERLFAEELEGHPLVDQSQYLAPVPDDRAREPWSAGNVALIGDAAHTAHFSVGSGTRMAMEDARAPCARRCSTRRSRPAPTRSGRPWSDTSSARRPQVESLQRAAQASLAMVRRHRALLQPAVAAVRVHAADAFAAHHARGPARARSRVSRPGRSCRRRRGRAAERCSGCRHSPAAADVHAVSTARARARQPGRRLTDVPVLCRRGQHRRLASRAPGQPRDRGRWSGDRRDDRRLRGRTDLTLVRRALPRRTHSFLEARRRFRPSRDGGQDRHPAWPRGPKGRHPTAVGGR